MALNGHYEDEATRGNEGTERQLCSGAKRGRTDANRARREGDRMRGGL